MNRLVVLLVLVVGLVLGFAGFEVPVQAQEPVLHTVECRHDRRGAFLLDSSGYPAPAPHANIKLEEGEMALIQLYNARYEENGWPKWILVPIQHHESGTGRFRIYPMHLYPWYYITRYSGCNYEFMMWWGARQMAFAVDYEDEVAWLLPSADHGPVRPELPMMNLPAYPDPLHACRPLDWQDLAEGDKVTAKRWEVEYGDSSAYGNYDGTAIVGPARMREFTGQCDSQRWWEPFAFQRLLKTARNPFHVPTFDVEFNPWKHVWPRHRAYLPSTNWTPIRCPDGFRWSPGANRCYR